MRLWTLLSHVLTTARDKLSLIDQSAQKKSIELNKFPLEKPNWRRKVNSPAVEAAIDQFTRHLVSEWVTDLWYSRITPDKDGPEELVQIINNVLGEISVRARDINLINLLTRDIINLVCNHLELYRLGHSKIRKQDLRKLPIDCQDTQLRLVLAAANKLHPALFSSDTERKVLQHLMNGLIQITFKPEDLQCSFFRYTVRELLACAVFRPVLNLANLRYRHFEELHKRLKEFLEYNLSLPPKRFLSSGLDVPVVQERCKLLDKYLKMLLQIPSISGSIEVWDFLSVDSQAYMFSDSLSIIQTLSVNLTDKSCEKGTKVQSSVENVNSQLLTGGENSSSASKQYGVQMDKNYAGSGLRKRNLEQNSGKNSRKELKNSYQDNSGSDSEDKLQKKLSSSSNYGKPKKVGVGRADVLQETSRINEIDEDSTIPTEILWPDGIFLTKHPNRKPPTPISSPASQNGKNMLQKDNKVENQLTTEQQLAAARRAKFVYELMIDKAPATLVSLVGRKEYERCAQDIYFFLQSPVCLKQLAFELLELLLLATFPELDDVVRQCHEDKEQFGVVEN